MRIRLSNVAPVGVIVLATATLILGTPTKAKACNKVSSCPAEFYPYGTEIDDTVYCDASRLENLGNQNWVFHCCTGNESPTLDLYIHMPDDSTPSDQQIWSGGQLD